MSEILFPVLSEKNLGAGGTVATWFAPGRHRSGQDELIAELAVDKVDMEITAPEARTLTHLVEEGAIVKQQTVIATIG